MKKFFYIFAFAIVVIWSFNGCHSKWKYPRPKQVIFISVDAWRADHLSAYGYRLHTTPFLERWSKRCIKFTRAISQAPWTIPSFSATFTGRYPHRVNVFFNTSHLDDSYSTLAEEFQKQGFHTVTFSGHPVLLKKKVGFHQGFDEVYPTSFPNDKVPTSEFIEQAIDWIAKHADEKYFFWIHMMEPHHPPTKNNPYISKFKRYDAETALVDSYIKRIVETARKSTFVKNQLIIVTADHGEALGDHHNAGHQADVYEEVMRVPFLLFYPPLNPGKVIETPIELIDIYPTLFELLHIKPPQGIDGVSLLPLFDTPSSPLPKKYSISERFYCRGLHHLAIRDERYKLYLTIPCPKKVIENKITLKTVKVDFESKERQERLFDMIRDPRERVDISQSHPKKTKELMNALKAWWNHTLTLAGRKVVPRNPTPDRDLKRALKSLGYLGD